MIKGPPQNVPAINPHTGRKTLYRAALLCRVQELEPRAAAGGLFGKSLDLSMPQTSSANDIERTFGKELDLEG